MDKLQQVFEQEFNTQVKRLIDEALDHIDISTEVSDTVKDHMENGVFQQYINDTIKQHVNQISIADTAIQKLSEKGQSILQQHMPSVVQKVTDRIDSVMTNLVNQKLKDIQFPERSIDPKLIDTNNLKIKKENIEDFGNTLGIEDLADTVQLTILNDAVVVENNIITDQIKATTVFTDTLIAKDVATDQPWVLALKKDFIESIPKPAAPKDWSFKVAEMEARIKVNEERGGHLKQLEVSGEALLSDVLYTTPGNNRVGINTLEPSDALTVWDQEAEVVIGKHKKQEGYIGTRRRQSINIGANNKVGITVNSEGTVIIDQLQLQGKIISSSRDFPNHASKQGDIVFNTNPQIGKYIGWVCLDGIRWAGFGKIE